MAVMVFSPLAGHAVPRGQIAAYQTLAIWLWGLSASGCVTPTTSPVNPCQLALTSQTLRLWICWHSRTRPNSTAQSVARIWDKVTRYGGVTSGVTSRLRTVGTTFAGPNRRVGNRGEAMITMHAISARGDSGAAGVNAVGEVIGHMVGGATGVYSVIHDIDYQLMATGATVR